VQEDKTMGAITREEQRRIHALRQRAAVAAFGRPRAQAIARIDVEPHASRLTWAAVLAALTLATAMALAELASSVPFDGSGPLFEWLLPRID
jgi:hypothetical protein